jgi:hypothetical protein
MRIIVSDNDLNSKIMSLFWVEAANRKKIEKLCSVAEQVHGSIAAGSEESV